MTQQAAKTPQQGGQPAASGQAPAQQAGQQQQQQQQQEPKQVPIVELHRERDKRQALQVELDQLREQVNQIQFGEQAPQQGQQFQHPMPQQQFPQGQINPAHQQLEQLWEHNPQDAVRTEIQMALNWYDQMNASLHQQIDSTTSKFEDFGQYAGQIRNWVLRLPAAQRGKPGIVELAYHAIKGQNVDSLLKKAQEDTLKRYQSGDFGSPESGGGGSLPTGGQGSTLSEQERAAAAAMGMSEEDYLKNKR